MKARRSSRIAPRAVVAVLGLGLVLLAVLTLRGHLRKGGDGAPAQAKISPDATPVLLSAPLPVAPPASLTDPAPAKDPVAAAPSPPPRDDVAARVETEIQRLKAASVDDRRTGFTRLLLEDGMPPAIREDLKARIAPLNDAVFRGTEASPSVFIHTVETGDTLERIAKNILTRHKVHVTPLLVATLNGVSPARIHTGDRLRVPASELNLLVDKSDTCLYVLLGEVYFRDYPIGVGKNDLSPEGAFTIRGKTKNPAWTDPETGKVTHPGDPGHKIGTRWLGFATSAGRTGFGIHGTDDPSSIGRAESAGCIRMSKKDVEELFDLVPEGASCSVRR